MPYLARVYVTLKSVVNDPQGLTVLGGLHNLGFPAVSDVRVGKYIEIKIDETEADRAGAAIEEICQKLLANPVIEDYRYELEDQTIGS